MSYFIVLSLNFVARQSLSERLVEDIRQIILTVGEITCTDDYYTPPSPKQEDAHTVFDMTYVDFQPYNFKVLLFTRYTYMLDV